MGRRYNNYWREDDCFNNYYEAFPKFQIVCETENHIGFINVPPKKEFQNPKGYAEIDAELHRISKIRISYIQVIEKTGMTSYAYRRPTNVNVESDMDWSGLVKIGYHRKNILHLFIESISNKIDDALYLFLKKYFSDPSMMCDIGAVTINSTGGTDVGVKLRKKKHHERYNLPHKAAQASPIEKIFKEELERRKIVFEEQVEIILEDRKFSVPDFVIRKADLLIYCDGTEFHKSPERIIMDKQQDRSLQTNGFTVFRFSGSEIVSNVTKCVDEITFFMNKKENPEDFHDMIARLVKQNQS